MRAGECRIKNSALLDMLKLLWRILTISLRRKPRPLGRRGCQERRKIAQAERKSPESEKIPDFYLGILSRLILSFLKERYRRY